MRKTHRLLPALALLAFAIPFTAGTAAAAPKTTTCAGGLAPGSYHKVVVPTDGVCFATGPVTINGGLYIEPGATFVLGSEEDPTPQGTIRGGVHATNAANVQIHFTRILGGVDIHGGSGPFYASSPFCFPECITWNAIEDNTISGGVTIDGYDGFWMGFIRNHVNGAVTLTNNVLVDPDGNEYVTNTINGSLKCSGNVPPAQVGDSGGEENVVTGQKKGECADLA